MTQNYSEDPRFKPTKTGPILVDFSRSDNSIRLILSVKPKCRFSCSISHMVRLTEPCISKS